VELVPGIKGRVRIVWQYAPTLGVCSFTATLSEYTVMKAAPVLQ
jgi:hypothetical protein